MLIQGFSIHVKWSNASCSDGSRIFFKKLPICLTESVVGVQNRRISVWLHGQEYFFLCSPSGTGEKSCHERPVSIKDTEESAAVLE